MMDYRAIIIMINKEKLRGPVSPQALPPPPPNDAYAFIVLAFHTALVYMY